MATTSALVVLVLCGLANAQFRVVPQYPGHVININRELPKPKGPWMGGVPNAATGAIVGGGLGGGIGAETGSEWLGGVGKQWFGRPGEIIGTATGLGLGAVGGSVAGTLVGTGVGGLYGVRGRRKFPYVPDNFNREVRNEFIYPPKPDRPCLYRPPNWDNVRYRPEFEFPHNGIRLPPRIRQEIITNDDDIAFWDRHGRFQ